MHLLFGEIVKRYIPYVLIALVVSMSLFIYTVPTVMDRFPATGYIVAFLQQVLASVSGFIFHMIGLNGAVVDKTVIHLNTLAIRIDTECGGYRSLVAFALLSIVICSSFTKDWRGFVVAFFLGIVAALIKNVIRILYLGIILNAGYSKNIVAEPWHSIAGLVVFGIIFTAYYFTTRGLLNKLRLA